MSTSTFERNLDFAPTATINKVALNNKVVMMRAVVRRAKLHMINKLVKTIQKLKNKKGTEEQQTSNKNKADRLLEEIKIIKMLRHDYVSKFALGSTEIFEDVAKNPSSTIDKRALVRLSHQKFIHDVVTKFRNEHDDWKELAAYLMTKHTSREYKTKKTKQKMKKVEANVKASETLVQAYLGEKLGDLDTLDNAEDQDNGNDDVDKDRNSDNDEHDDNDDGNLSDEVEGESSGTENVMEQNSDDDSDEGDDNNDAVSDDSDKDITVNSDDGGGGDDDDENFSESGGEEEKADEVSSDSGNAVADECLGDGVESGKAKVLTKQEQSVPKSQKLKKDKEKKKTMKLSEGKKQVRPQIVEKVEGEMIVKKINLDSLKEDNEIPAILLQSSMEDKPVKKRKKVRDMFFEMDHEEGDESGIDEEKTEEGTGDGQGGDAEEFNQYSDDTGVAGQLGVHAFSTTFVGSLRSNEMMGCKDGKYRSNEDWKRIRHEMKDNKMGRGGGSSFPAARGSFGGRGSFRGQPSFRGQGSFRGQSSFRDQGSFRGQNARGRGGINKFGSQSDTGGHIGRGKPFTKDGGVNTKPQKPEILHPSWEASKKRKQQQKGGIQAFSGKKIKFGDD